ncbi:hypothetical protein GS597_01350 [Synechococcales cyanobacterium C]|uniref:Uncharacterized protein n=1 Tax=Petrachloros mirabilis ULC683 TaxID=2781853 RepID=A0A8K2A6E5_9CYAN|nr:hypothetical protein [Petrachloros mirabilis]NCJ05185.1 hypothetical protein [Petrachloros mirabilis ULC683]
MRKEFPWRNDQNVFRIFCVWLGNQNKRALESGMSPYRAGLGYVINCEKTYDDIEKLDAAWEEFKALETEREAKARELAASRPELPSLAPQRTDEREIRLGTLRNMCSSGRAEMAAAWIDEHPEWGISLEEVL